MEGAPREVYDGFTDQYIMLARIGYEQINHGNTHGVLRNKRIFQQLATIRLTSKIIHNTPNVICRGTDLQTHGLTDSHIFTPDSGISSHSFGRSYKYESNPSDWQLVIQKG